MHGFERIQNGRLEKASRIWILGRGMTKGMTRGMSMPELTKICCEEEGNTYQIFSNLSEILFPYLIYFDLPCICQRISFIFILFPLGLGFIFIINRRLGADLLFNPRHSETHRLETLLRSFFLFSAPSFSSTVKTLFQSSLSIQVFSISYICEFTRSFIVSTYLFGQFHNL